MAGWYLMVWDMIKAEQASADEARKLAIALWMDAERDLVTWGGEQMQLM